MVVVGADVHKRTHTLSPLTRSGASSGRKSLLRPAAGNTAGRVRMTRSGNRQLNAARHRIAVTQIRLDGLGQASYRKRLNAGASKPEALRSLKRRLARIVFHHLHTDHQNQTQACQPVAA
jgi:transposase